MSRVEASSDGDGYGISAFRTSKVRFLPVVEQIPCGEVVHAANEEAHVHGKKQYVETTNDIGVPENLFVLAH